MRISFDVAMEVACHEAIIRQAYKDSVGMWTWSVGLTAATGHDVKRYIGKPQPLPHCLGVFVWALDRYADHVRQVFEGHALSQAEFAAILSWTWNLGGPALRGASWVDLFKSDRRVEAETSFKQWNKANGQVLKGLVNRRAQEADLLFRGIWSNTGNMTEYTQLTTNHAPIWSSARAIDVDAALREAIASHQMPTIDRDPQLDAENSQPTLTPEDGKDVPQAGDPIEPNDQGAEKDSRYMRGNIITVLLGMLAAALTQLWRRS